jgi:heat shock protein HslJ
VAASLLVAACGDGDVDTRSETAGLPSTRQDLEAHEWVLVARAGTYRITGGKQPAIAFSGHRASGTAPCNTFQASLTIEYETVELDDIATTKMLCAEPAMRAEAVYFAALRAVDHATVDEDDDEAMVLTGDGVRLVYRAFDADEALVGRWDVVEIASGDALTSVVVGTQPTLTFLDDGAAVIGTSCNPGRTAWTLDGGAFSVEPIASTQKACDDPPEVTEQDAALLAALEAAERIDIAPHRLTLLSEDGSTLVTATKP